MSHLREKMVVHINGWRIKGNHHRPGNKADGIQKIHHLKGHQPSADRKNEDTVTEPPQGPIVKRLFLFLFLKEDSIEEIDCSPHGAKPSTEEITEDEDEKKDPKGGQHPPDNLFLRKEGYDSNERIESQVEIDRNLQFEGKSSLNDQIKKEEEGENLNRPSQVRDYFCHVAVTLFTRTFERSISPNPNS